MRLRRRGAMRGSPEGRRERADPEGTGATEDAPAGRAARRSDSTVVPRRVPRNRRREWLGVIAFALFVLVAIVGVAFAVGYLIGRIFL
jgi:hypothetical protein